MPNSSHARFVLDGFVVTATEPGACTSLKVMADAPHDVRILKEALRGFNGEQNRRRLRVRQIRVAQPHEAQHKLLASDARVTTTFIKDERAHFIQDSPRVHSQNKSLR